MANEDSKQDAKALYEALNDVLSLPMLRDILFPKTEPSSIDLLTIVPLVKAQAVSEALRDTYGENA